MIRSRILAAFSAALLVLGLAGCGDDETGTGPQGAISITLSTSTLTITQGAAGTVTVNLTRQNGFAGAVAVAVEGLPTGVTAPAISIAAGQTSGTLNFTAAATAAAATTALTVRATGADVTAVTAALSLVVQAAPPAAFTMSLSPTTLTVLQGQSGNTTVTLTRTGGFAGAVALAATGLPNGVTASFNPASATGTTSTLTLTASATATTGAATVTITGTGTGVSNQTATLALTVTAATGFTMSLSPTTLSVQQGQSGNAAVTIARTGGFAADVALAATGLPNGVTASFNPASVTGTGTTSTLTLTASATATTGAATVTITGTATGASNQTVTLALTVTAAAGGFTMALSPTTLSVQQGQSGSTTVTITRTGAFTGAVALAATGLPNGVTAALNPASVTANTSTLTLTASATATTGAATVTLTGTGTGVSNQTATVALTVTAGSSGGGNVSASFCPSVGVPTWVAFQDGTGPWVVSTAVNGVYSGTVNSGRGGIAYVTPVTGGGFSTSVRYGSTAELQAFNQVFCSGLTGTGKTVNVTVAGAGQTDFVTLGLGSSGSTAIAGQAQPFQNVPDGTLDLLGARGVLSGSSITVNKLFAQRGITPAANSTVAVDFNGSNALDPVTGTLTITNLGTDQAIALNSYRSANNTTILVGLDQPSTSTTRTITGFPTLAGNFHLLQVQAAPNLSGTLDRFRAQGIVFAAVGAKTVALPADLGAVTVTAAATTPNLRLQAVVPTVAPYNQSWTATFSQGSGATTRQATVQVTSGYLTGSPATVTLAVPDLGAAYQAIWGLVDTTTNWVVTGQSISGFSSTGQFQEGATITLGARLGTYSTEED